MTCNAFTVILLLLQLRWHGYKSVYILACGIQNYFPSTTAIVPRTLLHCKSVTSSPPSPPLLPLSSVFSFKICFSKHIGIYLVPTMVYASLHGETLSRSLFKSWLHPFQVLWHWINFLIALYASFFIYQMK